MGISREAQDEYAIESYHRARAAAEKGYFKEEIQNVFPESEENGSERALNMD